MNFLFFIFFFYILCKKYFKFVFTNHSFSNEMVHFYEITMIVGQPLQNHILFSISPTIITFYHISYRKQFLSVFNLFKIMEDRHFMKNI